VFAGLGLTNTETGRGGGLSSSNGFSIGGWVCLGDVSHGGAETVIVMKLAAVNVAAAPPLRPSTEVCRRV